ncbi:hypothetical protein DFJ58DRAFT_850160 [Suillus subalutaceus]|uniref:uncharacterized protein n=1 Tax=Suillus subalutaceus TaxID=48586 RepID=UPI001B86748B|nr:uncharacterized protein DFJ58DRAFT_850160 [Suillus subalutaceus]KAG1820000.1 hypothetical protein DFJ58DRAFT_850160 [Suillus subalutaceus]
MPPSLQTLFQIPTSLIYTQTFPISYNLDTMAGADEDPSMLFVDDPFQFTLDLHAGYHPMYNPSAIPYQDSVPSHPSPQYFPSFPPPIVSIDGISTLAPGSEDIPPLGELPGLDEPLPLGDSFQVREPSPPPVSIQIMQSPTAGKAVGNQVLVIPTAHKQRCVGCYSVRGTLVPISYSAFTIQQQDPNPSKNLRRRTKRERPAAQEALTSVANAYDDDFMSTCKRVAHAVAPIGYGLRPSIWSEDSKQQYQIDKVKDLVDDPLFPLKFIFGNDLGVHGVGKLYAFENLVVSTVAVDVILKLGYAPYISTELDNSVFFTAAAACGVYSTGASKRAVGSVH